MEEKITQFKNDVSNLNSHEWMSRMKIYSGDKQILAFAIGWCHACLKNKMPVKNKAFGKFEIKWEKLVGLLIKEFSAASYNIDYNLDVNIRNLVAFVMLESYGLSGSLLPKEEQMVIVGFMNF